MSIHIPELGFNADEGEASRWLCRVIEMIGAGFHFDTPGADYLDANGDHLLNAASAARLDFGLDFARSRLGNAVFEELCLKEVWRALGVHLDPETGQLVASSGC